VSSLNFISLSYLLFCFNIIMIIVVIMITNNITCRETIESMFWYHIFCLDDVLKYSSYTLVCKTHLLKYVVINYMFNLLCVLIYIYIWYINILRGYMFTEDMREL